MVKQNDTSSNTIHVSHHRHGLVIRPAKSLNSAFLELYKYASSIFGVLVFFYNFLLSKRNFSTLLTWAFHRLEFTIATDPVLLTLISVAVESINLVGEKT